jgi:hypothetical protein
MAEICWHTNAHWHLYAISRIEPQHFKKLIQYKKETTAFYHNITSTFSYQKIKKS